MVSHGHYDAAVLHYTRAIEADANDAAAYCGRARALSKDIDLDEWPADQRGADLNAALADSDRAIALAPGTHQYYLNRGVIRAASGRLAEALTDMDQAVAMQPSDGLSHGYRGLVLLRMFRDGEAQSEFDRCVQLEPGARRELGKYIEKIKAKRGVRSI